ncbi:NADH:flavin oxidoreductase/NADH oxidase [Dietzia psychralcaliphila]|uniref:NADH:flavin oxidoreductase/NADH oxidase n=1 Tax=Dietzia psychralcaliphila TaxID=139021 RepID=UPI001C1E8006|nr:NADH:flavin oxidoreductase/NADH oxidase [Dietzia psychralcaliphila]
MSTTARPHLFDPWTARSVTVRNRTVVSPMCQYSASDGIAEDYHLVHLGRFAMGGFGLVMTEATSISAEGRLTHGDLGLWEDRQTGPLRRIVDVVHAQGASIGIQLGHAGAKSATLAPWERPEDHDESSRWPIVSVTANPHAPGWQQPHALTPDDLREQLGQWEAATRRAAAAGFDVLELHAAHGYLLHSFLSPLSNTRRDDYGGTLANQMRFPIEVVTAVRAAWPAERPLFVRLSAVDSSPEGLSIDDSVQIAGRLGELGVDVIDCSSGGIGQGYSRPIGPGYQVDYARTIRRHAGINTMAVGMVTDPQHADSIVSEGSADLVALGRQALAQPSWPFAAREALQQYAEDDRYDLLPLQSRSWVAKRDRQLSRHQAAGNSTGSASIATPEGQS